MTCHPSKAVEMWQGEERPKVLTRAARALIAASLGWTAFVCDVQAQNGGQAAKTKICEDALKEALNKGLKIAGAGVGADIPITAYDAWVAYLAKPDDEKLDAVLGAIGQGAAGTAVGIAFPAYGLSVKGGKVLLATAGGGVEVAIDEAQSLKLEAFICGGVDATDEMSKLGFFQLTGVQNISPGISCDNFADRITTIKDFDRLTALFKGFYSTGMRNDFLVSQDRLNEAWAVINEKWKAHQGERLYAELRAELIRQGQLAAASAACTALPATPHAHLELLKATPDERVMAGWEVDEKSGRIKQTNPAGWHAEYAWTPAPPKTPPPEGFSIEIAVTATSAPKGDLAAGITIVTGFDKEPPDAHVEVKSVNGKIARASKTIQLKPPAGIDGWTTGQKVYLSIGDDYGRSANFVYQVLR